MNQLFGNGPLSVVIGVAEETDCVLQYHILNHKVNSVEAKLCCSTFIKAVFKRVFAVEGVLSSILEVCDERY